MANKKYIIISDCDEAGTQALQQMRTRNPIIANKWETYQSFQIEKQILCLEDFYKPEYVRKIYNEKKLPITFDETNSISSFLKSSLQKEELQKLKSELAERACNDDLKSEYGVFVTNLIESFKGKTKKTKAN